MNKRITIRRKLTKARVRAKISGSSVRPRLSVRISNLNVTAQLIDDTKGNTLVYKSTIGNKEVAKKTMTQKAEWVGQEIAKSAKDAKIKKVVFDRGFRIYHGRVKALADAARANGLDF
ncbi:MAG: 50S ribosomal protein L18 [Candidatus Saccharibacteria bacterium]